MEGGDERLREGGAQQQQQQQPPRPGPVLPGTPKEPHHQPACFHQRPVHESQKRMVSLVIFNFSFLN